MFMLILFVMDPARGQGDPFATCFAKGQVVYGGRRGSSLAGVSTLEDLELCWERAVSHFGNNTIVGQYNLTQAEKYSAFGIQLAGSAIDGSASKGLFFDADTIANASVPQLGYLPFILSLSMPFDDNEHPSGGCPAFTLSNLSFNLRLHHQQPRDPTRLYPGFSFRLNGCGRERQRLVNVNVSALGYGNIQASFVSIEQSQWLSIEPPYGIPHDDAVALQESDIKGSRVRYFGDVTGNFGDSYGMSQNGSRAIDTVFTVESPSRHIPAYRSRPNGDGYTFSWYGTSAREWHREGSSFTHMEGTQVEYIRDVMLGSVNVSQCRFTPWLDSANPIFNASSTSTSIPPAIQIYNMESVAAKKATAGGTIRKRRAAVPLQTKAYGANVSNSAFNYIWDVALLDSGFRGCFFNWTAAGHAIPRLWLKSPPINPSFWVNLDSYNSQRGFVQSINSTLSCMRPALELDGQWVPAQQKTWANGTAGFDATFLHTTDARCRRSQ